MIRPLVEKDYDMVIDIININWKKTYSDYVSPLLLNEDGCKERAEELRHDFQSKRLLEYVWEERGYQEIIIWAFRENTKAISFYQKNGYVIDKNEYLGKPYLTVGTRLVKRIK